MRGTLLIPLLIALLSLPVACTGAALAAVADAAMDMPAAPPPPPDLDRRAGFDQRLGASIPMDLAFRDADGQRTSLHAIADGRPLLLALGYYRCPNLCDAVLHGTAQAVATLPLRAGRDFDVVFVSIDPRETPAEAADSQAMLAHMQPQADVARWHFLSGDEAAIHALAQSLGFRYFLDPRNDQYAHAAGIVIATAGGRVAQYFFGVQYPPRSLRLALVDASAGRLGNLIDQLVLLCCGYDPATGRYSLLIGRVMRILGFGFALLLGAWVLKLRHARRPA